VRISRAAEKLSGGNRAFASGNYITADLDDAEARADLMGVSTLQRAPL